METVSGLAVAAGLNFPLPIHVDLNAVPTEAFGVFVSVERSQRLDKWPEDIHGCIGEWDPDYQAVRQNDLLNDIKSVAKSATWSDDRRNYFKHLIYTDLGTTYKVYFMMQPVEPATDGASAIAFGDTFDNQTQGLIVVNPEVPSERATYLPGVFQDKTWNWIRKSLLSKAGIATGSFYAYDCIIYQMRLQDYLIKPIQAFLLGYYGAFIPYVVVGNKVIIDKSERIRNLATIYDLLKLVQHGYELEMKPIIDNIQYYVGLYQSDWDNQSSAFLLLNLLRTNPTSPLIEVIRKRLYAAVTEHLTDIDRDFELGEVLLALTEFPIDDKIDTVLDQLAIRSTAGPNPIFRYNWYSKVAGKVLDPTYKNWLAEQIMSYIDDSNKSETNYLAVEFEACCTLHRITNSATQMKLEPFIAKLMQKLERRRGANGLFQFTNGDARLDITGHVLNGYFALI